MSNKSARQPVKAFEEDPRIQVAYLYGSRSKGNQTTLSDIDIAVLLSELPENMLDYHLDLMDRISKVMGDDVDLVILNTAPPLLRYQVIKHGTVLYSREEKTRVEFEAKATGEYLDFSRRRKRYDEGLMEEISRWKR